MKTKVKKFFSVILLTVYLIGLYWFLAQTTPRPLAVILTMFASCGHLDDVCLDPLYDRDT